MDKENLRPTDRCLGARARRSSILKVKPSEDDDETTQGEYMPKSVRFSRRNSVKAFVTDHEQNTIWSSTYEVEVNKTDSTHGSSNCTTNATQHINQDLSYTCAMDVANVPAIKSLEGSSIVEAAKQAAQRYSTRETNPETSAMEFTCQLPPLHGTELRVLNVTKSGALMNLTCVESNISINTSAMEFTCQLTPALLEVLNGGNLTKYGSAGEFTNGAQKNCTDIKLVQQAEESLQTNITDRGAFMELNCLEPKNYAETTAMEFTCQFPPAISEEFNRRKLTKYGSAVESTNGPQKNSNEIKLSQRTEETLQTNVTNSGAFMELTCLEPKNYAETTAMEFTCQFPPAISEEFNGRKLTINGSAVPCIATNERSMDVGRRDASNGIELTVQNGSTQATNVPKGGDLIKPTSVKSKNCSMELHAQPPFSIATSRSEMTLNERTTFDGSTMEITGGTISDGSRIEQDIFVETSPIPFNRQFQSFRTADSDILPEQNEPSHERTTVLTEEKTNVTAKGESFDLNITNGLRLRANSTNVDNIEMSVPNIQMQMDQTSLSTSNLHTTNQLLLEQFISPSEKSFMLAPEKNSKIDLTKSVCVLPDPNLLTPRFNRPGVEKSPSLLCWNVERNKQFVRKAVPKLKLDECSDRVSKALGENTISIKTDATSIRDRSPIKFKEKLETEPRRNLERTYTVTPSEESTFFQESRNSTKTTVPNESESDSIGLLNVSEIVLNSSNDGSFLCKKKAKSLAETRWDRVIQELNRTKQNAKTYPPLSPPRDLRNIEKRMADISKQREEIKKILRVKIELQNAQLKQKQFCPVYTVKPPTPYVYVPSTLEQIQAKEMGSQIDWWLISVNDDIYTFGVLKIGQKAKVVVRIEETSGAVSILETENRVGLDQNSVRYIVQLLLTKLKQSTLESKLGRNFNIISLLDYIQLTVDQLREVHRAINARKFCRFDDEFRFTYLLINVRLYLDVEIIFQNGLALDSMDFENDIKIVTNVGNVNEIELRGFIGRCRKGDVFFKDFFERIDQYICLKLKRGAFRN